MIVSVTRDDLRDEFIMADEAFALSPISARATQPREEDYDAISDAFMETSRGRWFLGEYAKRNRNADTSMVLDAVARIEENLAAQKQPLPDSRLAEALAAIRNSVDEARAAASAALEGLALEQTLAPVRKGARVIREIAWRLREIGADGRICDLIDSQVSAIETGCGQLTSASPKLAVSAVFDLIERRIGEFGDGDTASPQPIEEVIPSPAPAPSDEAPAAVVEMVSAATETAEVTAEAADADDDAVLEMVALEMAAPDPSDNDDPTDIDIDEIHVAESPLAAPEIIAQLPEPVAEPEQPLTIQPSLQPFLQPSLGATLIANGIVRKPPASESDPLAPIRRMSQAEKIAFFS
jgi:hypothetical protein